MSSPPLQLILYVRPGCHLCDEAREALVVAGVYPLVEEHDITRDPATLNALGTRIPVLARRDTGDELNWPFGVPNIREFVSRDS